MLFQAIKKTEFLAKTPKIWNSQKGPPFGYFWQRLIFFLKNWKFEKRLCWNMSSTERNKVKSFGDPSIAHGEMADRFLIVGAFNAPPLLQIGLIMMFPWDLARWTLPHGCLHRNVLIWIKALFYSILNKYR